MACPKCESLNVCAAPDEAPAWAREWTKCFACGKRWDQAGAAPRVSDDDEVDDLEEDPPPVKRTRDDLVALIMKTARETAQQPKEAAMAVGGECTKKSCGEPAAPDSVKCAKHRD